MSNLRQATKRMRGGATGTIIAILIALLTVGAGVAFGAEGVRDGVMNFITETVGGVIGSVASSTGASNGTPTTQDSQGATETESDEETPATRGGFMLQAESTGAQTTDLSCCLENVVVEGAGFENGSYIVGRHRDYRITLTFSENDEYQFSWNRDLRYAGLSTILSQQTSGQNGTTSATCTVDGQTITVGGGSYSLHSYMQGLEVYPLFMWQYSSDEDRQAFEQADDVSFSVTLTVKFNPADYSSSITLADGSTIGITIDDELSAALTQSLELRTNLQGHSQVGTPIDGDPTNLVLIALGDADGSIFGVAAQQLHSGQYDASSTVTPKRDPRMVEFDGGQYYNPDDTMLEGIGSPYSPEASAECDLTDTIYPDTATISVPVSVNWLDEGHEADRPEALLLWLSARQGESPNSAISDDLYDAYSSGSINDYGRGSILFVDSSADSQETLFQDVYVNPPGGEDPRNYISVQQSGVGLSFLDELLSTGYSERLSKQLDNYTTEITGDATNGFVITNTHRDYTEHSLSSFPLTLINNSTIGNDSLMSTVTISGTVEDGTESTFVVHAANGDEITTATVQASGGSVSFSYRLTPGQYITGTANGFTGTPSATANFALSGDAPSRLFRATASGTGVTQDRSGAFSSVHGASVASFDPETVGTLELTGGFLNVVTVTPTSITRDDEEGEEQGDMSLRITEVLPEGVNTDYVDPDDFQLEVGDPTRTVTPTLDTTNRTLTYDFTLGDGETMSVPLMRGATVSLMSLTPGLGLAGGNGEAVSLTPGDAPISLNVTATEQQGGQNDPGNDPGNQGGSEPQHASRPQGWLRVNTNAQVNDAVTYDAYKVFDAAVTYDDPDYKATHLEWESNAVKSAVMGYLRNATNHTAYDNWLASKYGMAVGSITNEIEENPQNAAEWIAIKIADSTEDTTANTTPKTTKGDTFATQLAATLRTSAIQPTAVQPNTVTPLDQGYYLVATTPSTIGDGETGTAPIWAPVPRTGYTVTEKVGVPTFSKKVKDNTDDTTNYNEIADASTGQWLDFRLTTTMPSNLEAFPTYPLVITDVVPDGMDATIDTSNGFSVHLGEADITSQATATLVGRTLTVSVSDMRSIDGVPVTGNDVLTVDYRAKLNENSTKGNSGNTNTATLAYRADPLTETTASLNDSATVLTYGIQLDKVDEATRLNVNGAQFAVKAIGLGANNSDLWVKSDGSLTSTEAERGIWTTANGVITVAGLDEGTYDLVEVAAPNLYEVLSSPVRVVIDAQKDYANGSLTSLGATVSGGNNHMVQNPTDAQDGYIDSNMATGVVHLRASDVRQVVLPLTGVPVKTAAIYAGIAIAVISAVAYVMGKRNREDYED